MKRIVLASLSALALLGVAACSDNSSTDTTTTQGLPESEQPAPVPTQPPADTQVAPDDTTTQSIDPSPETGTGGPMPANPVPDAPAQ